MQIESIARHYQWYIGVFSKWSRTFIEFSEFSEFRESEESLKHELGFSIMICSVTCVSVAQG